MSGRSMKISRSTSALEFISSRSTSLSSRGSAHNSRRLPLRYPKVVPTWSLERPVGLSPAQVVELVRFPSLLAVLD